MWPKGSGILEMKVEDIRNTDVGGDCEHDPVEPADGQDESFRNYAHCLIFRSATGENDEDRRLVVLHQIQACRAIERYGVNVGDRGGFIQKEENLDQSGDAWVSDRAKVYENAMVCMDANVFGGAEVYGRALLLDSSCAFNRAHIYGTARLSQNVNVFGTARV
jgi:hypothetical protein